MEAMLAADQTHRENLRKAIESHGPFSPEAIQIWEKQRIIDQANSRRLAEIVHNSGWPKKSVMGEKATLAAFLVLQHSDLPLQKELFPIIREAAMSGEADLSSIALLEDRILMREGKKQLFGTQISPNQKTGKPELYPVEDESHVDERRMKMGLQPLSEYLKTFGINYKKPE